VKIKFLIEGVGVCGCVPVPHVRPERLYKECVRLRVLGLSAYIKQNAAF
jgi:hypothetical protein